MHSFLEHPVFENHLVGVIGYDPNSRDTLFSHLSDVYFTPASNVKIFTLYAALKILPECIPALRYQIVEDTLYIEGTGDPSLLHSHFKDSTTIAFLSDYNEIQLNLNSYLEGPWGAGWAWEDYDSYYATEKSALPLYGNLVTINNTASMEVIPPYFQDSVVTVQHPKKRKLSENHFFYDPRTTDTIAIPYVTDTSTVKNLLESVLRKKVKLTTRRPEGPLNTLPGIYTDSLARRMMHESDNFLAEQLLLLVSSMISDTLSSTKARAYILENYLDDLKQPPRWVDGSGLSRYNLFSPESMVQALTKLLDEIPRERLLHLFPAGGVSGTMKNWYPGNPDPYLFAKTGSLGNNHSVSGYLVTRSGKILIVSFMNNHFLQPSDAIKMQMQSFFEWVRDTY